MLEKYYVFFDFDGTLINSTSMLDFLSYFFRKKCGGVKLFGHILYKHYLVKAWIDYRLYKSRERLNQQYYRLYKGREIVYLTRLAADWYESEVEKNSLYYKKNILEELQLHQKKGGEVVFVSGSSYPFLAPFANKMKVKHILATELEIKEGIYTGEIKKPMIGAMKADAITQFLSKIDFTDLGKCYAYGDHYSDKNMLELVGNPRVVAGDPQLEAWAKEKNITIIQ